MNIELASTNRTLLMPLWGRAKATGAGSRILRDPRAVEVAARLDVDLRSFDQALHPSNELFTIARARALDDIVRAFHGRHPQATVISLGAGLDTGFDRVDNGQLRWLDVDLPDVIELRKQLIPETPRSRCIAASILEDGWLDPVTAGANGLLFLASGVLAYFRAAEVAQILRRLARAAPGAEMAFDMQSPLTNLFGNRRLRTAGMGEARFRWGAFSARPLRTLCPELEVLEAFGIFAHIPADAYHDRQAQRMARTTERLRTTTVVHGRFRGRG